MKTNNNEERKRTFSLEDITVEYHNQRTIIKLEEIILEGKKYFLNFETQFYSFIDEEASYQIYRLNPNFNNYNYVLIKTKVSLEEKTIEITIEEFYKTKKEFETSKYYTTRILDGTMLKA